LSPKRKLSHDGILVLGGLCVDPGYKGRLLVGLYNFSSTRFPLRPGKKLIAGIFYELDREELDEFPEPQSPIEDFPDELVRLIQNYKPIELQGLLEELKGTQRELAELKTEINTGREWQRNFREGLEAHNRQINDLLVGLREEKATRAAGEEMFKRQYDAMTARVDEMQKELYRLATKIGAIIGGIVIVASIVGQAIVRALSQ
jgi:hypothetical protein